MGTNSLAPQHSTAITLLDEANVQRTGARILSTLDRLGVPDQEFSRIVVYGRRVVVFDLPWLSYAEACDLVEAERLGERLTHLIGPRLIALRERQEGFGSVLIIDLAVATATAPRPRYQSRFIWCPDCDRLMPREHTHEEG